MRLKIAALECQQLSLKVQFAKKTKDSGNIVRTLEKLQQTKSLADSRSFSFTVSAPRK